MSSWPDLLTELASSRGAALHRYAFLLCCDDDQADDLVQAAFVRTFSRFRTSGWTVQEAESYLRTTLLRLFIDDRRRSSRWRDRLPALVETGAAPDCATSVADSLSTRAALTTLSPRQRACLVLRFFEDLPVDEIARRLGCSSGNVKRHLSDGLGRLAGVLGPAGALQRTEDA